LGRLITLLTEKLNLKAIAKDRRKKDAVAEFLAKEIADTNPDEESSRYEVLVKLFESRGQKAVASRKHHAWHSRSS